MARLDDEPPLAGAVAVLATLSLGLLGALLGVVSAFFVPFGPRVGVRPGPVGGEGGGGGPTALAEAATGSYGTVLSVGVALAFLGCLALGLATRRITGIRMAALGPVSGFLVVALLALSNIRGDLVLPAEVTPGIAFLYAGVIGGAIPLLPGRARRAGRD